MSKLQVLSFMFISKFKRCPFLLKLTSFVLYVSKPCMLRPLILTKFNFSVKSDYLRVFWSFYLRPLILTKFCPLCSRACWCVYISRERKRELGNEDVMKESGGSILSCKFLFDFCLTVVGIDSHRSIAGKTKMPIG
ncbi:hypothetical protein Hanom_Chr07g00604261 [Helianthus anomalus]